MAVAGMQLGKVSQSLPILFACACTHTHTHLTHTRTEWEERERRLTGGCPIHKDKVLFATSDTETKLAKARERRIIRNPLESRGEHNHHCGKRNMADVVV